MTLKQIVERNDTPGGRVFDLAIQSLILLSLISFSLETLPNLSASTHRVLDVIEVITVAIFSVEYLLRIAVTDRKLRFITSLFGIIDLAAILPFYITTGVDLRAIRILRFLRLFRAFKLLRYGDAIQRLRRAVAVAKEELVLFFFTSCLLLFVAAVGIYYFEHDAQPDTFASVFHSLWWAVATLTTVGYGDIYPVTVGGKVFTFFVLMIGLGIIAVPAGVLASALGRVRNDEQA